MLSAKQQKLAAGGFVMDATRIVTSSTAPPPCSSDTAWLVAWMCSSKGREGGHRTGRAGRATSSRAASLKAAETPVWVIKAGWVPLLGRFRVEAQETSL